MSPCISVDVDRKGKESSRSPVCCSSKIKTYDTATNSEKLGRMCQTVHQNEGFNALQINCSNLNPACNAFFQFLKQFWKGTEESVWFENQCLGINKLSSMMKELSKAANLSQVYITASGQQF